jgi:CDP-diacylglycerol--serine O-phosphatidyltransferase
MSNFEKYVIAKKAEILYSLFMTKHIRPLGYKNLALPITFAAVASNFMGVWFAFQGFVDAAMVCLILAGIFDMFDGPIARRQQKRSQDELMFGIELDSLADVINFGFVPALLLYMSGLRRWFYVPFFFLYILCAIVRLAYFNVRSIKRFSDSTIGYDFVGLPVTSAAASFPVAWLIAQLLPSPWGKILLTAVMLISAILFVSPIRVPKIRKKQYPIVILLGIILVIIYAFRI